jgi:hypothetical protein
MPKRPPKPPDRASSPRHRQRNLSDGTTQTKTPRRTLSTLGRELPSMDEFEQIDREVLYVHDRAAAILLVSQVERFLEIAIVSRLFHQDKATVATLVSTFSAKIRLAYAMGFISEEERKDLDRLREVRNAFAHALRPITFTNELIIGHTAALKCAMGHSPDDLMPRSPLAAAVAGISQDPNRLKFIEGCRKMSLAILNSVGRPLA